MKDSYTMAIEESTIPIEPVGHNVFQTASPAEFIYKACPKCTSGTLYSAPTISAFNCLVCGWTQTCNTPKCFGEQQMHNASKVCNLCGRNTYVTQSANGR